MYVLPRTFAGKAVESAIKAIRHSVAALVLS